MRFKPGDRADSRLVLPLHQRLRMRKTGEDIVAREPPEFLDALMNTVMADPVKLPDSGRYAPADVPGPLFYFAHGTYARCHLTVHKN